MAGSAGARQLRILFLAGAAVIALASGCTAPPGTPESTSTSSAGSNAAVASGPTATSGEATTSGDAATSGEAATSAADTAHASGGGALDAAEADRRVGIILGASSRYEELIRAVLVNVDGQPVVERYGVNGGPDVTGNTFSVTKSVMSMLIGIAIDEGSIRGVDQTLGALLPRYVPAMAPGVAEVTLRQVLTMTGGIRSDDDNPTDLFEAPDWVVDYLSTPLEQPAGTGWAYSSRGSHLLSAVLVESTGRRVLDFAREKLFDPLGISTEPAAQPTAVDFSVPATPGFAWPVDPQGYSVGFAELTITPPDMAKLGQLYLDGGIWNGRQIVPADWVAESTEIATGTEYQGSGYGYQWWVDDVDGQRSFSAVGWAGQLIHVVPDLGLVVVVSCLDGPAAFSSHDLLQIMRAQILPVVSG